MTKHTIDMAASYHALHTQLNLVAEGVGSCGEDSYFISTKKNMMGIADGVSAWSAYGLGNSGYLAFYLMSCVKASVERRAVTNTLAMIHEGMDTIWNLYDTRVAQMPNGSSTITTIKLEEDPVSHKPFLEYTNLGDCMVMVIRSEKLENDIINYKMVHYSKRLYAFHEHARGVPVPLQLVFYPAQGRKTSQEQTEGSDTQRVDVQSDDIIILATDGLWDNLSADETLKIVSSYFANRKSFVQKTTNHSREISKKLVEAAYNNNFKPDDITCVVGIIGTQK
eukprot:TRINITY_DN18_c0_g1_i1.p1 TRINITY_DN18_c0_g1~~TRINITY_DN18_c0_g1_i1.p1  ORF type:complete len:280 (-),score=57.68 TRINITY_DN18_c0_g1_i1:148-987(-)